MSASSTPSPVSHDDARPRRRWPRVVAWLALGLAVVALLAIVVAPLVWPVRPLPGLVDPTQLRQADSRFAIVDGRLVHYKLWGSPKAPNTILLLHGFGASVFSWRDVGPALAADGSTKVVAIDRTGFGLTERPVPPDPWAWRTDSPYSYRSQAQTAFSLLDQLNVPRAAIIGHSQGAAVAVTMADMSPQRVRALVLVAPAVNGAGPVPSWIAPVLRTPQGRRVGPLLVRGIGGSATDSILRSSFANPASATPAVIEGYRTPLRAKDWDVALWEMSIAPQPIDPAAALPRLAGVPTLVIVPADDRIVKPDAQRRTASAIPDAKVVEVPGANHLYHEEQAKQFAASVRRFLGSVSER